MDTQNHSEADSQESAASLSDGLAEEAQALIADYRTLASDHVRLAALEARQAGESLVKMVIIGVMTGGLLVLTWLCLVAALVFTIVEHGVLSASLTLLIVGLVHLALVLVGISQIRRKGRGLLFSALVRDLDPRKTQAGSSE